MVQHNPLPPDQTFAALGDPARLGVLDRLGRGDATVTELATAFGMTLTGMQKHIGVLERAGLVATHKQGRVRTCRLGPARLEAEAAWLGRYRALWSARFDALDAVLAEMNLPQTAPEGTDPP